MRCYKLPSKNEFSDTLERGRGLEMSSTRSTPTSLAYASITKRLVVPHRGGQRPAELRRHAEGVVVVVAGGGGQPEPV